MFRGPDEVTKGWTWFQRRRACGRPGQVGLDDRGPLIPRAKGGFYANALGPCCTCWLLYRKLYNCLGNGYTVHLRIPQPRGWCP